MAKKKDKDSDEEYEFKTPEFDEDAFIHKELVSFRTTSILFVWGIIAALISWGIFEAMDGAKTSWFVGIAIMAVFAYLLRFIYPALKVDISHFGRREWFGTFFLIFFAWLAFFILFINPPISDHADPTVDVFVSPSAQMTGGDVTFDLFVADNFRVDEFTFTVADEEGQVIADQADLSSPETVSAPHNVTLELLPAGEYTYTASVTDRKGNTVQETGFLNVSDTAVDVSLPDGGTLDVGDEVFVSVRDMDPCTQTELMDGGDCIRTVGLVLDDGGTITMDFDDDFNAWKATNVYKGWAEGSNTFHVVVEQQDRFQGIHRIPGASLESGPFTVDVPDPEATKDVQAPPAPADAPVSRHTPGFGLVAGVVVLVGATAVARRRQE